MSSMSKMVNEVLIDVNRGRNEGYVEMTDDTGKSLMSRNETEPLVDSVVLTDGPHGHALQRHTDGLWYPVKSGKGRTWDEVMTNRNVVLVYDAEPRPVTGSPTGRTVKHEPQPQWGRGEL
jgi:hypothetical protein